MTSQEELFRAILAMDSYNRGYNAGIANLTSTLIGNAFISTDSSILVDENEERLDQPASFYAVAYDLDGETVISYRGTDSIPFDVPGYGLALGVYNVTQARLAAQFYLGIAATTGINNISLTGHSLGGGLAGFVSGLYGSDATIFDSMPFEDAATFLATAAAAPLFVLLLQLATCVPPLV